MSRRGGGAGSAYDVEAHWSSSDDEGYSYRPAGRRKGSAGSADSGCGTPSPLHISQDQWSV